MEKIIKTKLVNGKDGDTITISVESTTEHEAMMTGNVDITQYQLT